ncbi:hypothetical protein ACSS6W_009031 [Trichoderma asperelloides]
MNHTKIFGITSQKDQRDCKKDSSSFAPRRQIQSREHTLNTLEFPRTSPEEGTSSSFGHVPVPQHGRSELMRS